MSCEIPSCSVDGFEYQNLEFKIILCSLKLHHGLSSCGLGALTHTYIYVKSNMWEMCVLNYRHFTIISKGAIEYPKGSAILPTYL